MSHWTRRVKTHFVDFIQEEDGHANAKAPLKFMEMQTTTTFQAPTFQHVQRNGVNRNSMSKRGQPTVHYCCLQSGVMMMMLQHKG
ncbi:unnamed protein product [Calypogeia fissa]